MESLTLKPRTPVQDDIECWDDDEDLQGIDDLQFRNVSSTTVATNSSAQASHHRDSISSRLSTRSDMDSNGGGDEDWQVLLPNDDETSTSNAIASAKNAGIPIPANVPTSALLGGTIKRLGGRKLQKVLGDDWGEDLEMPKPEDGGLKLRKGDEREFPEALRQISLAFSQTPSLGRPQASLSFMERMHTARKAKPTTSTLDKFRDDEDDDFGDVPTIKIAKSRSPQKPINFIPPPVKAVKVAKEVDSFDEDFEFPAGGEPLKLSTRKEAPKTPASQVPDDFDTEWAEGSLGTRFGGTRRDGRSNRSSSFSALSPSVSSCLTAESEDEGLDGLILPDGPLKFDEVLKKRLQNASPEPADYSGEKQVETTAAAKEDFFKEIEIGDGDVFDSGKLTLNRNIKHKAARQTSPARRTAMTLTFTNKPQTVSTRIPKLQSHDKSRSRLEPVSESGGPIISSRRPQSRMGGHSSQSSISSIPTPSMSSFSHAAGPSTPSRRGLTSKPSREGMRMDPTTTSAQLLKSKRSMPVLRNQPSPARPQPSYQRPPSRSEHSPRGPIPPRPKTPVDRSGAESSLGHSRKLPVPFLPAGTSHSQSHHISIKSSRQFHRPNSSDSSENAPSNRPISRLSNAHYRPHTPTNRRDLAPEALAREAASKRTLTKPTRRRAFGDGTELEVFDDLPTSASIESRFVKQPIGRGAPKPSLLRSKLNPSQNASSTSLARFDSPQTPSTPLSPMKYDAAVPRFARETTASRIAREQRIGSLNPLPNRTLNPEPSTPLAPLSTNWKTQIAAKSVASPRHKRGNKLPQKPCLIKPLGDTVNTAKSIKGMHWNPQLFRWEGNENALAPFDAPLPLPGSPKSGSGGGAAGKPALIANVGSTKGVQVVGGMVFDPQRMCWLKMAPTLNSHGRSESGGMSPDAFAEEEDDPFAGLDDLDDGKDKRSEAGLTGGEGSAGKEGGGLANDEWLVGEEFDVGPEFVRRQRAEEEKWRRKVEGWVGEGARDREGDNWRWAIRGLVSM
ncbi:hypothetical protein MMC24_007437 [Lignoscripta atroalba]|nr:hypothetical protein [Lignoscripta atroalba]